MPIVAPPNGECSSSACNGWALSRYSGGVGRVTAWKWWKSAGHVDPIN